jgi:2-polyprenyl-3-methyl-5-hydroxy-6-metoxy-1,4-benzoquinol methylase
MPLKDNTFDIVMSNATIEHIGNNNNQIKFVKETVRLCKKLVFISTPNRYFPIDFHTLLPFIHWLPKKMHRLLLKTLNLNFFAKESNLNLLSINNLKEICSVLKIQNYKIIRVRLFFFTTNLILIIKKN